MQQMLSRAPAIKLTDLQKDEAVMLVSTQGTGEVTVITLLAGVEPLLEAPAASQNLLSNWSMGSGGAEAAAQ
jgi:predicted ABC-type transport system involved in lysophospholipase L1 biosynthesis ATPase subunit